MDIVVLTTHYPDESYSNGQTAECHYFARSWAKDGHCVLVFHVRPTLFVKQICAKDHCFTMDGVVVKWLKCNKYIPKKRYLMKRTIDFLANQIAIDIHASGMSPDLYYVDFCADIWEIARKVADICPAPLVPVFHNHDIKCKEGVVRRIVDETSLVGARSPAIAESIRKIMGPDADYKCLLAQSGAPVLSSEIELRVKQKMDRGGRKKLLYVGWLIPLKNVDVAIEALRRLDDPSLTLDIVGEGSERGRLEGMIKDYQMGGQVKLLGRLERQQVLERMAEADCFVMVSSPETFGLVYIEAMACGCYVIGSKGEGIDGVLVDGVNGALVQPGNIEALEDAFRHFRDCSVSEYESITKQAKADAAKHSEDAVAARLLKQCIDSNDTSK